MRKIGNKILAGKWYFLSTKKLFLRLWSGLKHYESRVKHRWKNIGRRTPLGLEKERRLRVKYGYTFQYLKGNDVGINRCTILNPNREVLYYKISYHEIEQVVPKLYSYARNSLKFKLAPKSRPPFSYATCLTEAKQEYRRMNRFRKIAAFTNFKNALALAACLEREWGSNCPSLGRWAAQVIAAVNGSHGRGNRNWVLIKGIYQTYKNRLGSKLFSQLALNFGTGGKWKRYEK